MDFNYKAENDDMTNFLSSKKCVCDGKSNIFYISYKLSSSGQLDNSEIRFSERNEYISITQLNLDRNRDSVCQRERERERERESLSSWRICCLDTMATTQLTKIPLTPGHEWFLLTIGVLHIALFHHDEWKFTGISCAIHAFIDFTV